MSKNSKKDVGVLTHKNGVSFRVWAPNAQAMMLTGTFNKWTPAPMTSEEDGYWYILVSNARSGQEYKYLIMNGDQELYRNDPRSLQLTTANGNSVIIDTNFDWQGDDFVAVPLNQQIVYELHVGTFNRADASTIGTFEQAIGKLDYLADLGINTIELMPISTMAMDRGWGYASDYIYSVESLYGGRHGFLEFVRAAHQRGISVTLDVVYNHFGPDEKLDLWQFDGWSENNKGGIYFYNDWRSKTPWGETRPDYGRPEVQQYILDNVRMWLQDCHLDGLRVDSTIYMRNFNGWNNNPEGDIADGWSILQHISNLGRKIKPDALLIAEDVSGNEAITRPSIEGGAGFTTQWEVTFPQILRNLLDAIDDKDRHLSDLADELKRQHNGDVFSRVLYSDSHDSAGNDGAMRLNEEIAPGNKESIYARKRSLLASSIVLTAPGIPMLLQGQEFMQPGSFNDWQALNWSNREHFAGIVLATKHLIALRKNEHNNTRGLSGQSFNAIHVNDDSKVLAYHRWDQGGAGDDTIVVINFTNQEITDYIIDFPYEGVWKVRFNSGWKGYSQDFKGVEIDEVQVSAGKGKVAIGPYATIILSQDSF